MGMFVELRQLYHPCYSLMSISILVFVDEMEVQNTCLQNLGFSILPLLQHIESNLCNHHLLGIVLSTAFVVVLATPD